MALYFYISSIKTNQMWQKVHFFTDQWQFEVIYKIFCHFGIFFWDLRSRTFLCLGLEKKRKFLTKKTKLKHEKTRKNENL